MANDDFTTVDYRGYKITIQKINDITVINLMRYNVDVNGLMIPKQPDIDVENLVDHMGWTEIDDINGIPVDVNNLTYDWIEFFCGGILELADRIIVTPEVYSRFLIGNLEIPNLHKIVSPIGDFPDSESVTFISDAFETWYVKTEYMRDGDC